MAEYIYSFGNLDPQPWLQKKIIRQIGSMILSKNKEHRNVEGGRLNEEAQLGPDKNMSTM